MYICIYSVYIYICMYVCMYVYMSCIHSLDWTTGLPLKFEDQHYNSILVLICSLM